MEIVGGNLPDGFYRITVYSNLGASVHDLAGLRLDGDGDGSPGGDFVRNFSLNSTTDPVFGGGEADDTYFVRLNPAGTTVEVYTNATALGCPATPRRCPR